MCVVCSELHGQHPVLCSASALCDVTAAQDCCKVAADATNAVESAVRATADVLHTYSAGLGARALQLDSARQAVAAHLRALEAQVFPQQDEVTKVQQSVQAAIDLAAAKAPISGQVPIPRLDSAAEMDTAERLKIRAGKLSKTESSEGAPPTKPFCRAHALAAHPRGHAPCAPHRTAATPACLKPLVTDRATRPLARTCAQVSQRCLTTSPQTCPACFCWRSPSCPPRPCAPSW